MKPMDVTGRRSKVLVLVGDLFFKSRIRQTAETLGVDLAFVASDAGLKEALGKEDARLLIVDLAARAPDPYAAVALARGAGGVRTLAFVSHVDEEARRRAFEAGCDEVLPKSAFTRDLPRILGEGSQE